ncbi:MAG: hypothetical protein MK102_05980 [Fuerstiella sp.]|nr:hypothetical protein [Fuerstiella sp.]
MSKDFDMPICLAPAAMIIPVTLLDGDAADEPVPVRLAKQLSGSLGVQNGRNEYPVESERGVAMLTGEMSVFGEQLIGHDRFESVHFSN